MGLQGSWVYAGLAPTDAQRQASRQRAVAQEVLIPASSAVQNKSNHAKRENPLDRARWPLCTSGKAYQGSELVFPHARVRLLQSARFDSSAQEALCAGWHVPELVKGVAGTVTTPIARLWDVPPTDNPG